MGWLTKEARRQYNRKYYRTWNKKNKRKVATYLRKYRQSDKGIAKRKAIESTPEYKERMREKKWRLRFRLTRKEYNTLLKKQNGVCACCRQKEKIIDKFTKKPRRLCVDHNHQTGKRRGLLCMKCNVLLGYAYDNPTILKNAIKYLKYYET